MKKENLIPIINRKFYKLNPIDAGYEKCESIGCGDVSNFSKMFKRIAVISPKLVKKRQ